jgi:glycosyltransferase involved in cell wall biosynthesis
VPGPLVDIVLPTHGPVPYLGEALASAFAQSYPAWRLTVVDNSPETGGAEGALAPYRDDARVRYIATGGLNQAENWNTAFAATDAPYVAMLHDDDLWDPDFLERRVAGLEQHPECAFVFSAYREIDEQGDLVGVHAARIREGVLPPSDFVPREFARNVVAVISVMYRRSALDALGDGPFRAGSGYIDYDLWLRLGVRFPVLSLHTHDCSSRSHGGSVTTAFQRSPRHGELWVRFAEHAEATIDAADPQLVPPRVRQRRRAAALLSVAVDEVQGGDRDAARRLLRDAVRLHPTSALDPRTPVLAAAIAAGPRSRRVVATLRGLRHRWDIPLHDHDFRFRIHDLRMTVRRRKAER